MEEISEKILEEMKNYYTKNHFDQIKILDTKNAKNEIVNAVIKNNHIENDEIITNIIESYFDVANDVINHKIKF